MALANWADIWGPIWGDIWAVEGEEPSISPNDDVQIVIAGTSGAIPCHVVHTGGTAVRVVNSSSIKVSISISGGTAIKVTI